MAHSRAKASRREHIASQFGFKRLSCERTTPKSAPTYCRRSLGATSWRGRSET